MNSENPVTPGDPSASTEPPDGGALNYRARWIVVAASCVVAALSALLVWSSEGVLVNTGDYFRVTPFLHIIVPERAPALATYPFTAQQPAYAHQLPGSLLAMVAWVVYHASHVVGIRSFTPSLLYAGEYVVFFAGVFFAAGRLRRRHDVVTVGLFIVLFLLLGFFLRSFYDESLILVLSPWLFAGLDRLRTSGGIALFVVAAVLVVLSEEQMAVFVPVFVLLMYMYLPRSRSNLLRTGAVGVVLVAGAGFMAHASTQYGLSVSNTYDRVYNGIGLAMGGVGTWRSTQISPKVEARLEHAGLIPRRSCSAIPPAARTYLGTSYYPVGAALHDTAFGPGGTPTEQAEFNALLASASITNYVRYLVECPALLPKLTFNAGLEAIRASYDVDYLRQFPSHPSLPSSAFNSAQAFVLRYLGWIVACLLLALLAVARGVRRRAMLLVGYIVVTISVVAGDGFNEFQKHLLGSFMLLPLAWFVAGEEWRARHLHAPGDPSSIESTADETDPPPNSLAALP